METPYRVFIGETEDKNVRRRRMIPHEITSTPLSECKSAGAWTSVVMTTRLRPSPATASAYTVKSLGRPISVLSILKT
jgi:hypothetical protein